VVAIAGFAIWGITLLEQKFDPMWFLPPSRWTWATFETNVTYICIWCKLKILLFPFLSSNSLHTVHIIMHAT
jgi:hypothetical protein